MKVLAAIVLISLADLPFATGRQRGPPKPQFNNPFSMDGSEYRIPSTAELTSMPYGNETPLEVGGLGLQRLPPRTLNLRLYFS